MKKIMFNDRYGLTKAVLEGRKTMTRRMIPNKDGLYTCFEETNRIYIRKDGVCVIDCGEYIERRIKSPNKVGDVLAVAQSYESIHDEMMMSGNFGNSIYDPFRNAMVAGTPGWKNKMFVRANLMPHQIRITNIRVEKLQDITEEDCMKEGIQIFHNSTIQPQEDVFSFENSIACFQQARVAFSALISHISGKGIWAKNPFVWVYEFELIR